MFPLIELRKPTKNQELAVSLGRLFIPQVEILYRQLEHKSGVHRGEGWRYDIECYGHIDAI